MRDKIQLAAYRKLWKARKRIEDPLYYNLDKNSWRNGGIKRTNEVIEKYSGQCMFCGQEDKLSIHHIDNNGRRVKEKNNDLNNLILVCNSCHHKLHGIMRKYIKSISVEK